MDGLPVSPFAKPRATLPDKIHQGTRAMQFEVPDYAHVHIVVGPPASAEGGARFEPVAVDALVTLPGTPAQPPQRRHVGRLLLKSGLAVVLLAFSFAVGQHFGGAPSLHAINTASGLARDVATPQTAGQVPAEFTQPLQQQPTVIPPPGQTAAPAEPGAGSAASAAAPTPGRNPFGLEN
jgi:hypothetical protein